MSALNTPKSSSPSVDLRPPRFDHLPVAIRSALRMRGALVDCGPGVRGVGWPETPSVRLAALAPWFITDSAACHHTAAWVWGVRRRPGAALEFALRTGRRAPLQRSREVRLHELRLTPNEKIRLGDFEVTTPERTLHDLLHLPENFGTAEAVACRLLMQLPEMPALMRDLLFTRQRPFVVLARRRFLLLGGDRRLAKS